MSLLYGGITFRLLDGVEKPIRLKTPAYRLSCMNGMHAFIEQGLKAAQGAVLDMRAQAGLHLEPDSVSRRVRARVRGG